MNNDEREFPETDCTKWVVRTKSAPLSATGTHEVIATFERKAGIPTYMSGQYGPYWRRTYEVVKRN